MVTLCSLIATAYDVRGEFILGAPVWMTKAEPSLYYNIQATTTELKPAPERVRDMLKGLLEERFQLMQELSRAAERPVFDRTVLTGQYTFVIERLMSRRESGQPLPAFCLGG
jgi:hypothetical protein